MSAIRHSYPTGVAVTAVTVFNSPMSKNSTSQITVNANQYSEPIGPKNDVLTRVRAHIGRFVAFSNPNHSLVLSLWALHTWAFDAADVTPYIYVSSIDPGSGKTTLMETLADITRNSDLAASTTAAVLFRNVDENSPTMFIDEVDTIYSGSKNDDLRNVLNSGYQYNGKTQRFVNGEATDFSTFCPKCLGGIDNGEVPATVMDRSIRIRLRRVDQDTLEVLNIERRSIRRLRRDESLADLKADLSSWANIDTVDILGQIADAIESKPIEGLSARQWDITLPLVSIARLMGCEDQAREAIAAVFHGERTETPETIMLRKVRDLFESRGNPDRLSAVEMAEVTGYSTERMGRIMGSMGLKSKAMKIAGETVRGYYLVELAPTFEKHLD